MQNSEECSRQCFLCHLYVPADNSSHTHSDRAPTGTHLHVKIARRGTPQSVVRGRKRGERDGLACCEESCWRDGEHDVGGRRARIPRTDARAAVEKDVRPVTSFRASLVRTLGC